MLYPAPASLMIRGDEPGRQTAQLRPGPARDCDLGPSIRLPALSDRQEAAGWKSAGGVWLTSAGMRAALNGQAPAPDTLIARDSLWSLEARVGIARDSTTRTTGEGALYSPRHVRLADGVGLGLWMQGLSRDAMERLLRQPHAVGGESRSAWITPVLNPPELVSLPDALYRHGEKLCYTLTVLTPLPLAEAPRSGGRLPGVPGQVVSACLPRPLTLGGWDSVKRRPLPLRPHLAPGGVLFMQADTADEGVIRELHGTCIGERAAWGYGLILIGIWNQE